MAFDAELDALFSSSVKAASHSNTKAVNAPSAAHAEAGPSKLIEASSKKRKFHSKPGPDRKPKKSKVDAPQTVDASPSSQAIPKESRKRKAPPRALGSDSGPDSDSSDDNADLENAYAAAHADVLPPPDKAERPGTQGAVDDSSGDSDDDAAPPPVHEALSGNRDSRRKDKGKKTRYVPPGETREQRNARTIFIGNVPVEAVKAKATQKQLKHHILSFVPSAKIESIRFRSVAFQNPTSSTTQPEGRTHERERAANWRKDKGKTGEEDKPVERLTSKEKKRIAYIKSEIHTQADAVHAYFVFAHADPSSASSAQVMDPHTAVQEAVKKADGSSFMGRTLRIDAVVKDGDESRNDPRRTVFVGNVDFASKEEDLRVFFEGVVSAERGPPGVDGDESEDEDEEVEGDEKPSESKPKAWVTHVRIVRDKDTLLGKGFAYVEFADRECVDELLAMEEGKLKFAKRKLRLQRCKTLPGSAPVPPPKPKTTPQEKARARTASTSTPVSIPKGNPELGARLAHLPKDARKAAKAADAERVARRLAKKKARAKLNVGVSAGDGDAKKQRERVRKTPLEKKAAGGHKSTQKKGRIRSEKSVAKRNVKK